MTTLFDAHCLPRQHPGQAVGPGPSIFIRSQFGDMQAMQVVTTPSFLLPSSSALYHSKPDPDPSQHHSIKIDCVFRRQSPSVSPSPWFSLSLLLLFSCRLTNRRIIGTCRQYKRPASSCLNSDRPHLLITPLSASLSPSS
jgi:hypothetical protein